MDKQQKYSPKYWVCHDKNTDDVFIDTMNKSKDNSVAIFLGRHGCEYYNHYDIDVIYEKFLECDAIVCDLIEINLATSP